MNEKSQLDRVSHLLSVWGSKIALQNAIDFNDINKISEGLAANLLNAIYGYSLKNLNEETRNFPAVDLGDDVAKIAFQVTSTTNSQKIQSTLEGFVHNQLAERFTNGVRFFFLTTNKKIKANKNSREKYQSIYNGFDSEKHLLTLHDLIQEIQNLQTKDKERFHKVLEILKDSLDVETPEKIVELLLNKHQKELLAKDKQLQAKDEQLQAKDEERKSLIQAVTALSQGKNILGTEVQIEEAMSALTKGDTTKAENLFEQVTQKGEQEAKHTAQAYRNLGALAYLHDTQKALNAYRRATELDPDNGEGWTQLGHLLSRIGELDKAIMAYEKVLKLSETHRNQEGIAAAYGNLGNVYRIHGELDKTIEFYKKALAIYESLNIQEGIASQYNNLGVVYKMWGQLDKAIEFYQKALILDKILGNKEGIASDYTNLGNIYATRKELDKAIKFYKKSLAINEILGIKEMIASNYGSLGNVYRMNGNLNKSIEFHQKALSIDKSLDIKGGMASDYCDLGSDYFASNELDKAAIFYRKSLALDVSMCNKQGMAENYVNLGSIYKIQGNKAEAKRYYQMSMELFTQLGSCPDAQKVQDYLDAL